jgi:hypothetical protein
MDGSQTARFAVLIQQVEEIRADAFSTPFQESLLVTLKVVESSPGGLESL